MNYFNNSVILIGMPGAGKSTIGLLVAKALAKDFIDTDIVLQTKHGKTLQDIIREGSYLQLRALEEEVLLDTHYTNHVIATGGSAVYSEKSMQHLKHFGPIIFLDVALEELERRIDNMDSRGIARHPSQSFSDLFIERRALYLQYADIIIKCHHKTQEQIVTELIHQEASSYTEKDA